MTYTHKIYVTLTECPTCNTKISCHDLGKKHLHWTCPKCEVIQIPHMVWNADLMLQAGYVSRVHPILDWFLYGVDLIEIVSIINVGMIMYSLLKKRYRK